MMQIILPAVFLTALFFDARFREGYGGRVYIIFGIVAVLLGVFAGSLARADHMGASLSGMISIFMR